MLVTSLFCCKGFRLYLYFTFLCIFRYIQNLMEFGLQWKLFEYIFLLHCIILLLSWRFFLKNNLLNWAAAVGRTHCRWMTSSFFPDPRELIRRFGAERADLQFETSEERKIDRSKYHETSQKARNLLCVLYESAVTFISPASVLGRSAGNWLVSVIF